MATYEHDSEFGVVRLFVRPEDLLHLVCEGTTLYLPAQHVAEWPDGNRFAGHEFVPCISTFGGGLLTFPSPPEDSARPVEELLKLLEQQLTLECRVEFITDLELVPWGPSRWSLGAEPRTGDGWTAVWQARLLETTGTLPGVQGPLMQVARTQPRGFEAWGVMPFTAYPDLLGAVFRTELAVSGLGASGRIRGPHWPEGTVDPGVVKSYDHKTQFGRDQEWTQVLRGHLSSGHPAELKVVTSRVFAQMKFGGSDFELPFNSYVRGQTYYSARLYETTVLTVVDPVVRFDTTTTPFRSLRLTTQEVAQVDNPNDGPFWVTRGQMDVRFGLVATDWADREIPFSAPLMFIPAGGDRSPAALWDTFNSGDTRRRQQVNLGGLPVTLADSTGHAGVEPGHVTLPVHTVTLTLASLGADAGSAIVPHAVDVALDAVGRLTSGAGVTPCLLKNGIDASGNFLSIEPALTVSFSPERVGGLATPNARLGAVSAMLGAVPAPGVAAASVFESARLLGVPLAALLADAQSVPPLLSSLQLPDSVVTRYVWAPELKGENPAAEVVRLAANSTLKLEATITQPLAAGQPSAATSEIEGRLTHVTLSLLDLIDVAFGEIHFQDKPGATPSVTATGCEVTFKGDLKFVADLAAEIADFGSGSPVTVDSTGIRAGYVLAIPKVAFGVFSLSNISLGAQVLIPFQDAPASVRFNFAERHSPFGISVGIFGGGGFLAVTATAKELERIEGSLEFGGTFEIDVVVAKGGVFAMGGVSFLRAGGDVSLDGYLRCGGHLKILDLVGITLEFEVVLGYREQGGKAQVHGSAELTVGVQVLLFNESVSFTVERTFAVSDDRDTPLELGLDDADWDQFCAAFA